MTCEFTKGISYEQAHATMMAESNIENSSDLTRAVDGVLSTCLITVQFFFDFYRAVIDESTNKV